MPYELKLHLDIKTFGPLSKKELIKEIHDALWACEKFRDVLFLGFECPDLDINKQSEEDQEHQWILRAKDILSNPSNSTSSSSVS